MSQILDVYLRDTKAGELVRADDGTLAFAYASDYLASKDAQAISASMPLQEEPYADRIAQAYFAGLLPDESARGRLARALGVSESNSFGLLEVIGGECAGALTLMPAGQPSPNALTWAAQQAQPLSQNRLAEILALLRSRPLLGGMLGVRLSLAGAQDKLAVCVVDGHVALATDGQPTTHILKPHIEGLTGTIENEVFCMRLAKKVGLMAPGVSKGRAGKTDYYLIERYDRTIDSAGLVSRVHQEDFCQALGIAPQFKYEDEGGPSVQQSMALLRSHARAPAAETIAFLRMLMFHFLIGNADAHGKNYALLYRANAPDLAPVYDALCTAAYPSMTNRLAMSIGQCHLPDTIHVKHWRTLVPDTAPAQRLLRQEMLAMTQNALSASEELARELREEGIDHPIIRKIQKVIKKRAEHLAHSL